MRHRLKKWLIVTIIVIIVTLLLVTWVADVLYLFNKSTPLSPGASW